MRSDVLIVIGTLGGALIGFFGQEFRLWRQHRRRFDEARQIAYTNLVAEVFRINNAFMATWSPFSVIYERQRYFALLDDVTRAIAAVRVLASQAVYEATIELMNAVNEAVEFANSVLTKDAKFGIVGWYLFNYKPMPVARHTGWQDVQDKLGRATNRFVAAAQEEINVPGKRQAIAADPPRNR